jgi:hypothetical protein
LLELVRACTSVGSATLFISPGRVKFFATHLVEVPGRFTHLRAFESREDPNHSDIGRNET